MTIATATISGQIILPDLSGGKMVVTLDAYADASLVTYPGMAISGKIRVPIADNGTATVTLPKIPQSGLLPSSGVQWHAHVTVGAIDRNYYFTLTADTTWDAVFTPANAGAAPTLLGDVLIARDAAVAAASATRAGTWQATTAYVAGQTIQAPDGSLIKTATSRTSRATFDATEQTFWTPVATTAGTLEQVAQQASNDARFTRITEPPLNPYRYGFVGDGTADDTTALQNTINAVPAGGAMELPHSGNAKITAPLNISKAITILGRSAYSQRLLCVGTDGFRIATGVNDVHIQGFELAQSVRYATTANAFVGITVDGLTGSRPTNHRYRDLYIDGFKVGFQVRYLWASTFDNCRTDAGFIGLAAYGLSVNNAVVNNCAFSTFGATAGSRGIALIGQESASNSTAVASEGWMISDLLTYQNEIGIDMVGTNHVYITNSILDFNTLNAVRSVHSGTFFGNNIKVQGCYIGMTGSTAGAAGVLLANAVSNVQRRYARIMDNELVAYAGTTIALAIDVNGSQAIAIVRGNTSTGFSTADLRLNTTDNIAHGNAFLSGVTPNILVALPNDVADNVGSVQRTGAATTTTYSRDTLGRKTLRATAAPTTGTWALGDTVINDVPTVGQPKAWVCTVAGSPGTWVSQGNL